MWSTSTRISGEPAAFQLATIASKAARVQCCTVPFILPPSWRANSPKGESCTASVVPAARFVRLQLSATALP